MAIGSQETFNNAQIAFMRAVCKEKGKHEFTRNELKEFAQANGQQWAPSYIVKNDFLKKRDENGNIIRGVYDLSKAINMQPVEKAKPEKKEEPKAKDEEKREEKDHPKAKDEEAKAHTNGDHHEEGGGETHHPKSHERKPSPGETKKLKSKTVEHTT